jgi:hypothetical protein
MRFPLLAKTLKWGSVACLLLASMSWHSGTTYQLVLDLIVYTTAIIMLQQAVRSQEYFWAAALAGMVLLLNPVVPAFTPAGDLIFFLFLLALFPLVIAFAALIDANVTLYPNVITEPYFQDELRVPKNEWAAV